VVRVETRPQISSNAIDMNKSLHRAIVSVPIAQIAVLIALFAATVSPAADDPISVDLRSVKFKVPEAQADLFGYDDNESRLFFFTSGPGEAPIKLPADGDYEITVRASCDPALGERAKFKVALDGEPVGMELLLTDDDQKDYKLTTAVKAGEHKLVIEFTNDAYKENEYDRNLFVYAVTLKKK
jgi:hypothetical protein